MYWEKKKRLIETMETRRSGSSMLQIHHIGKHKHVRFLCNRFQNANDCNRTCALPFSNWFRLILIYSTINQIWHTIWSVCDVTQAHHHTFSNRGLSFPVPHLLVLLSSPAIHPSVFHKANRFSRQTQRTANFILQTKRRKFNMQNGSENLLKLE